MKYDIPLSVTIIVGHKDSQIAFVRNALIQAAKQSGLPMSEQIDFASLILRLPINLEKLNRLLTITEQQESSSFRMTWIGKDPSPQDGTHSIQDLEFKKLRGNKLTYFLNDSEKEELRRRQIYYQLNGGILGSNQEIFVTDIIIVNLNFIYDRRHFSQATAQASFQKQIAFAERVYGLIEIKFYPFGQVAQAMQQIARLLKVNEMIS